MVKFRQLKVAALVRTGQRQSLTPQLLASHTLRITRTITTAEIQTPSLAVFGAIPLIRTFVGSIAMFLTAKCTNKIRLSV